MQVDEPSDVGLDWTEDGYDLLLVANVRSCAIRAPRPSAGSTVAGQALLMCGPARRPESGGGGPARLRTTQLRRFRFRRRRTDPHGGWRTPGLKTCARAPDERAVEAEHRGAMSETAGLIEEREHATSGSLILTPAPGSLVYPAAEDSRIALKRSSAAALERGLKRIVVDLSGIETIDSTGLSILVGLKRNVDAAEADLVLAAPLPVMQVFVVTKLNRVFKIVSDLERALA